MVLISFLLGHIQYQVIGWTAHSGGRPPVDPKIHPDILKICRGADLPETSYGHC